MQSAETDRQWIFPGLQFTCRTNLTGWIFTETSEDVVCPTLELWNNFTATSLTTDYRLSVTLTPDNFTEPTTLSGFVYSCTLHTAIVVDAGAVIGFKTRSPGDGVNRSNVMLIEQGNLVGYYRDIFAAAALINTAIIPSSSGVTPLIIPITTGKQNKNLGVPLPMFHTIVIATEEPPQTTPTENPTDDNPTTQQPVSTSDQPDDPSPADPSTSLLPITTSFTPLPRRPTTNSPSPSKSDASPVVLGIVVATVTILVIAAVVFLLLIIVVVRHRKQAIQNTTTIEKGQKDSSLKLARVQSRNSYSNTPIYEEVSDNIVLKNSVGEHDYDYISSARVRPAAMPEKYEIPQKSPSSSQNGSVHEDLLTYETPVNACAPVKGSTSAVEDGYDTPVHAETVYSGKGAGKSGYDSPTDASALPNSTSATEEGVYDTPVHIQTLENSTTNCDLYETPHDVGSHQ